MAITKHLKQMFEALPRDKPEFTTDDISPSEVYRMEWVLRRCVEEGLLTVRHEWKVPGNMYAGLNSFYKFTDYGN
jgi:hypothetical protein